MSIHIDKLVILSGAHARLKAASDLLRWSQSAVVESIVTRDEIERIRLDIDRLANLVFDGMAEPDKSTISPATVVSYGSYERVVNDKHKLMDALKSELLLRSGHARMLNDMDGGNRDVITDTDYYVIKVLSR